MVHLRRDFQAMIDRGGAGEAIGRRLLRVVGPAVRGVAPGAGRRRWKRRAFQERIVRLEAPRSAAPWRTGRGAAARRRRRTCAEILRVEEGLWTFVRFAGVEPTNNAAERALRHAVIWRRISGGTDSESGSRFVERMLTVVATCRQQGRNVLDYLTSCFEADSDAAK